MPLLHVTDLVKHFPIQEPDGPFRSKTSSVKAVDGVSLDVSKGETLGIVGESGCGKSTLGRAILRLYNPDSGTIEFNGVDIGKLSAERLRQERRRMQMVFQDPYASLNPRMRIRDILAEPLRVHAIVPSTERKAEVARLLEQVGLPDTAASRYPHEFSGGQRQRIGIARALAVRPQLIVADEPISALDVSIRAQILNVFRAVQRDQDIALIFIAHDLGAVRHISNRVAVMYLGKIVEIGPAEALYTDPRHPYTRALLAAVPTITRVANRAPRLTGDVPSPIHIPSGCRFRSRCPLAQPICAEQAPALAQVANADIDHRAACHFSDITPAETV